MAIRANHCSGAGHSVHPKVDIRSHASKPALLRGSNTTGFKARTLHDWAGPQAITCAAGAVIGPLLCPGGAVNAGAGGVAPRDGGLQVQVPQTGNPNLKPEKSKSLPLGLAVEPVANLTVSADDWNITLRDQINAIDQVSTLANPDLHGDQIVRCNTCSDAQQCEQSRCGADNLNGNAVNGEDRQARQPGRWRDRPLRHRSPAFYPVDAVTTQR